MQPSNLSVSKTNQPTNQPPQPNLVVAHTPTTSPSVSNLWWRHTLKFDTAIKSDGTLKLGAGIKFDSTIKLVGR